VKQRKDIWSINSTPSSINKLYIKNKWWMLQDSFMWTIECDLDASFQF